MTDEDWGAGYARLLGVFLNGDSIPARGNYGERVRDDSFLLWFNAGNEVATFAVPEEFAGAEWLVELDTGRPDAAGRIVSGDDKTEVGDWAMLVLRRLEPPVPR